MLTTKVTMQLLWFFYFANISSFLGKGQRVLACYIQSTSPKGKWQAQNSMYNQGKWISKKSCAHQGYIAGGLQSQDLKSYVRNQVLCHTVHSASGSQVIADVNTPCPHPLSLGFNMALLSPTRRDISIQSTLCYKTVFKKKNSGEFMPRLKL